MSLMLQTLGPRLDAHVDGVPIAPKRAKKAKLLLALLAAHHQHDVSREWVAARVWPDSDPISGAHNLRQTLSDLRQSLGADAARIVGDGRNLRLDINNADIDVAAFDKAVAKGDPESLKHAVDIYAGPFLEGIDEPWIIAEREPRHRSVLAALDKLACSAMETEDIDAAIAFRRKAVSLAPLDEPILRNLMIDLRATGDHAGMVDALRAFEKLLAKEDPFARPSAETIELVKETRTPSTPKSHRPFIELPERPPLISPITELIGRNSEIQAITQLLARKRLVTLVGTGGVGKTRLALAVAREIESTFYNGAVFVDLAAITDPALVATTVATSLMMAEALGRVHITSIVEWLRDSDLLVILDNCEHMVQSVAEFASMVLQRCPNVRVLVTSREPLEVTGEKLIPVAPLNVPHNKARSSQEISAYPAIQLFVERAQDAWDGFSITESNAEDIATICRSLDGIPLALELAAVMVSSLDLSSLAQGMRRRFAVLVRGSRTTLPRHQTLQAVVNWGYELLTSSERLLLRRLSVFNGSWRFEDATAVCSASGPSCAALSERDILVALPALVRKSFVSIDETGERFRLLETIREFAATLLSTSGELEQIRARHVDVFYAKLEAVEGTGSLPYYSDLDNIRSAMDWAVVHSEVTTARKFCSFLAWFAHNSEIVADGRARFEKLLSRPDLQAPSDCRMRALQLLGWFCEKQADLDSARHYLRAANEVAVQIGEIDFVRSILAVLVHVEQLAQDNEAALRCVTESIALSRQVGCRALPDLAVACFQLGTILEGMSDFVRAEAAYDEALDYCNSVTLPPDYAWVVEMASVHAASNACRLRKYDRARQYIRPTLLDLQSITHIHEDPAYYIGHIDCLLVAVRVAVDQQNYHRAARLRYAIQKWLVQCGYVCYWEHRPAVIADFDSIRSNLTADELALAELEGQSLAPAEILAIALDV